MRRISNILTVHLALRLVLFCSSAGAVVAMALWCNPPRIVFSNPTYRIGREGDETAKQGEGDSIVFVLAEPSDGAGIVPEWEVRVSDRSQLLDRFGIRERTDSQFSWYLPMRWKDQQLSLEPGALEPAFSNSLSGGHALISYEIEQAPETPNVVVIRTRLVYSPYKGSPENASRSMTITVMVDTKKQ